MQKRPTRPERASKRERPAKPSRAERPSRRSARRPSKKRGALCRNCGMELRPGETICPECGAKVGGSSVGIYVLVMIIIVILVAIAVVATAATGVLPEPVNGHVRRAIETVGLGVYFQRFSAMVKRTDTPSAKKDAPAPPEAE
jgi:ribosomal protein L32